MLGSYGVHGNGSSRYPELTDGWYKIHAQVDPPLRRALDRGIIRVGRKLAMCGVKVDQNWVAELNDNSWRQGQKGRIT